MIPQLFPGILSWDEVDPSNRPFDSASAAQVVRSLGPAQCVPRRPDIPIADPAMSTWSWEVAGLWADAMSYALVRHYGRWTLGWRWSHDEGDFDGGPVGNWCCPRDSVTTPEDTLDRVTAALCEWRGWLEDLARWFEAHPLLDLAAVDDQRILWERAARNLIIQVSDRTGAGSGWHGHCRQVLTWFLTRWAVAPETARELVDRAIDGRFLSWTSPDTVLVDDVAESLARSLRPGLGAQRTEPEIDHLERWLVLREEIPWHECPGSDEEEPVVAAHDGAAEDINGFDAAIDVSRAEGLLRALRRARSDAARTHAADHGPTLDFELIRTWQQHVLDAPQPPPFRSLPAFAKGGRERYGIDPDTRARFDRCLAESALDVSRPLPLTARAARAYLDVCFFHPFDDGNARAAFLTLIHILAREHVTLESVRLLRRIGFAADEPRHAMALARYIDLQITETRSHCLNVT